MIALLKANSLTVKNRFSAERFALNLSERQSTATITVGPQAPVIGVNDWLQDEAGPQKGIVWRVKTIDTDFATDTRTLNCEHLITSLRDRIMFGEVSPATITGNSKATTCTAAQAAQYVLKQQGDWKLGTMGFSKSAPYNFNGDDLLSALETISSSLLEAWWSYDFTTYPFKISIKPKSTAVACEMRMDRNIRTLKKTIDRTRMYTRFYPIGKNNLKLGGGGYVSKNESLYGIVSKVETDGEKDTADQLRAWANERLNNHAEPLVTVTISGMDLSEATGESLDRLTLGTVCRVPLPEFDTIITERITKLSWSDVLADPESVSITLANQAEDVASIVNRLQKTAGSGGRSAAKKAGEDHAWFVDTETHVGMVAEAVAGPGADKDWSRVASVFVDGDGVHQKITKTQGELVVAEQRIESTEKSWTNTVQAIGKDGKITSGSICLAINESNDSEANINASKIYLLGQTIANQISADYIKAKMAAIPTLNVNNVIAMSIKLPVGGSGSMSSVATETYVKGCVYNLRIQSSGSTYTLQQQALGTTGWTDVGSFSRATTLGGQWSGGTLTVTATPQGNTLTAGLFDLTSSDVSWNGTTGTIRVNANLNGGETKYDTGKRLTVSAPFSQVQLAKAYTIYDTIYYGRLYDANGNALTSGSYYWYGASYNYDGGSANATFYRHT